MKKMLALNLLTISAFAAQQAPYAILPDKEEIQQAVVESDVVVSRQLVPQLAPLIAAYADNTITNYLSILPHDLCFRFTDLPKREKEVLLSALPEIAQDLGIADWIIYNAKIDLIPEGAPGNQLSKTFKTLDENKFPKYLSFPLKLVIDKKEGDKLKLKAKGIPFEFVCTQSPYGEFAAKKRFENAIEKLTFLGKNQYEDD